MGTTTGISWTDATANFVIGCQHAGPGCDACYAEVLAANRFGIHFGPDGERRVTKAGFTNPIKWQHHHEAGRTMMPDGRNKDGSQRLVPVPRWVFACSLSDFFDNRWPPGVRARAWKVIKECRALRWQLVTKRVGNVADMLPEDWDGGRGYEHVGIVATVVDQGELDRDAGKIEGLYDLGVKWTGLSIEPQLGPVKVFINTDWIITGGESRQQGHEPRPYDLGWARMLIAAGKRSGTPVFVKQMGSYPVETTGGLVLTPDYGAKGDDPERWPEDLRVQEMPRVYD